jgi:hypothetical protein
MSDPFVNEFGMSVLIPLTALRLHQFHLWKADGVEVVMTSMATHLDSERVQSAGVQVLSHLSDRPECRVTLTEHLALPAIVIAIKRHIESQLLVLHGNIALSNLTCGNPANQEAVVTALGIDAIVAAMHKHGGCATVQQHACTVLANLAGVPDHVPDLIKGKAVEAITFAMHTMEDEALLQQMACFALGNLAVTPSALRRLVKHQVGYLSWRVHWVSIACRCVVIVVVGCCCCCCCVCVLAWVVLCVVVC